MNKLGSLEATRKRSFNATSNPGSNHNSGPSEKPGAYGLEENAGKSLKG
jgi:hypothetical protein